MAAQIWLDEVDDFRFQEDKPAPSFPVWYHSLRCPPVQSPGRYSQHLGGFRNVQELHWPIILYSRHTSLPFNVLHACILRNTLDCLSHFLAATQAWSHTPKDPPIRPYCPNNAQISLGRSGGCGRSSLARYPLYISYGGRSTRSTQPSDLLLQFHDCLVLVSTFIAGF